MRSTRSAIRLSLLLLLCSCDVNALECPIDNLDITERLRELSGVRQLGSVDLVDPDSEEPIRRYLLLLDGGTTAVVQQKNCEIHNLSVSLFVQGEDHAGFARIMSRLAAAAPTWTKWFGETALEPVLGRALASKRFAGREGVVTESLDESISSPGESSEVLLSRFPLDRDLMPYDRALTLSISVGGL